MTAMKIKLATFGFAFSIISVLCINLSARADGPEDANVAKPVPETIGIKPKAAPTEITASKITYDLKTNVAYFIGNVHVVDQDMDLKADELRVYRNPNGEMTKVEAEGRENRVLVKSKEGEASAKKAVYDLAKGEMEMTGNPMINYTNGTKLIDAKSVLYNREQSRFSTKGGRPRLIIPNTQNNNQSFKGLLSTKKKADKKKEDTKE